MQKNTTTSLKNWMISKLQGVQTLIFFIVIFTFIIPGGKLFSTINCNMV